MDMGSTSRSIRRNAREPRPGAGFRCKRFENLLALGKLFKTHWVLRFAESIVRLLYDFLSVLVTCVVSVSYSGGGGGS